MRAAEILAKMLLDEGWWDQVKGAVRNPKAAYQSVKQGAQDFRKDWGTFWDQAEKSRQLYRDPPESKPVNLAPGRKMATHLAVVYGPNLPKDGYYMTGQSLAEVITKLHKGLTSRMKGQPGAAAAGVDEAVTRPSALATMVNNWLVNGYVFWLRDGEGNIYYFGDQIQRIAPQMVDVFGAKATSTIRWIRRMNPKDPKPFDHYKGITGRDVGVPLSDEEIDAERERTDAYAIQQAQRRNAGLPYDDEAIRAASSKAKQIIRDLPDMTYGGSTTPAGGTPGTP